MKSLVLISVALLLVAPVTLPVVSASHWCAALFGSGGGGVIGQVFDLVAYVGTVSCIISINLVNAECVILTGNPCLP